MSERWMVCAIGLGGNITNELGTPTEHIMAAVAAFRASADFIDVRISSLYTSVAYGVTDQPDFVNAVLLAKTRLEAHALLDFCQSLEQTAGRVRRRHWGERSLDADVLSYGDEMIHTERLTVPHPELSLRNFVLIPLIELEPEMVVCGRRLADLPVAKDRTGLAKLTQSPL